MLDFILLLLFCFALPIVDELFFLFVDHAIFLVHFLLQIFPFLPFLPDSDGASDHPPQVHELPQQRLYSILLILILPIASVVTHQRDPVLHQIQVLDFDAGLWLLGTQQSDNTLNVLLLVVLV